MRGNSRERNSPDGNTVVASTARSALPIIRHVASNTGIVVAGASVSVVGMRSKLALEESK